MHLPPCYNNSGRWHDINNVQITFKFQFFSIHSITSSLIQNIAGRLGICENSNRFHIFILFLSVSLPCCHYTSSKVQLLYSQMFLVLTCLLKDDKSTHWLSGISVTLHIIVRWHCMSTWLQRQLSPFFLFVFVLFLFLTLLHVYSNKRETKKKVTDRQKPLCRKSKSNLGGKE